jgi:IclR family acetate operon transcriptional repressor
MTDQLGTEAAARVADVLLAFLQGPRSLGVSALARELGLSKAVVHRILQTLVHRGLLTSDLSTREYHLGPAAAALGARSLRESDLRTVAMPVLRELQQATGETTTVSALVPGGRVYLDQVESVKEIKMTVEVGRRFPLHAGSSSTCILAFLPTAQQDEVLAGRLDALTPRTVVEPDELRDRLREVVRTGVAQSDGERQAGAGSVAAPVFGVDGSVQGAVSVCGPADRVGPAVRERYVPLLVEAADRISRGMGWRGGLPVPAVQGVAR